MFTAHHRTARMCVHAFYMVSSVAEQRVCRCQGHARPMKHPLTLQWCTLSIGHPPLGSTLPSGESPLGSVPSTVGSPHWGWMTDASTLDMQCACKNPGPVYLHLGHRLPYCIATTCSQSGTGGGESAETGWWCGVGWGLVVTRVSNIFKLTLNKLISFDVST
jgi:hypothetical protein